MNHMHLEDRIEAPVEHVWAFYCDTSHWEDRMLRSKASDFSGPVEEVGTTFVQTMRVMGYEMESTNTVVEVAPLRPTIGIALLSEAITGGTPGRTPAGRP